ncbi:uncharacterized protein EDB93DRAFT_1255355 [Suillus bovinus]|uniref:uncharacterized protein n=1 Tax=Suillus bovinus TaxID=48563 RepID=UPI001B866B4D|nr:uncharacterized protein EDB93DRAFT_1255355 [Suillus bovinus]KAG2131991.1 hypothetical protein EDB93DRAFT_1255355 [Suillus bovinus]
MHNEIIELTDSDSDSDARLVKQEPDSTSHLNPKVATLKANLTAKTKLAAEQGKELTKLREENKQLKNEQNLQTAEIAGLQDELKNILRQLDEQTVKNLNFNMIKLTDSKFNAVRPNGTVARATGHHDVDQDMSDSFASNLLMPEHPPDTAPSQPSNSIASRSSLTVTPEPVRVDTTIEVVIKSENEPDLIERLTFVKGEDGKAYIWNLDNLGLGPPVMVEERFRIGFRRSVISDALGGGYQTTSNNWQGPTKTDKYPYLAMTRSYNPHLPLVPGGHGVVFCEVKALKKVWGGSWVERTNAGLVDKGGEINLIESTEDGIREALDDGRLAINFTVMKCVGYRTEWFEQFLHYQAHPKASTSYKRKKKVSSGAKKPSAKRVKGSEHRKEMSSESVSDDELEPTPPGSDED